MDLLIDLATMAVMHPGGIPATDLSLVQGDKLPLRITLLDDGVPVTPTGVRPALAIKTALAESALVLAATNLEPVDDAIGPAYAGSLSVNTTQLVTAMGSADTIDLVGEAVLMAGDGSQRTSSLIRVTVRRDILPADVVPPEDVIVNWDEMVAAFLATHLDDALHEAGMYVTPATGACSLSPPGYDQDHVVSWSWARFRLGDDMLAGYVGSVYKIRDVGVWAVIGTTDTTPRWLDVWRRAPGGDWVLAARSTQAVASSPDVDLYMWGMVADTEIVIGDEVALHVYGGTPEAPVELPLAIARQRVTAAAGRGIAASLDSPITDATVMPALMLSCTYSDGVSVGGVNLATRAEVDRTKDYVINASKEVYASARQVSGDADQVAADKQAVEAARAALVQDIAAAQAILDAIPQMDAAGNMTLAGGMTAAGTINANGGVRVPAPATAQEAISYEALMEQQALQAWRNMTNSRDSQIPSWVTAFVRKMQISQRINVRTSNATIKEGVYGDRLHDFLITMTAASGMSLLGLSSAAYDFPIYLGDYEKYDYAAACVWRMLGADKASILLGSTSQGYGSTTTPDAACYAHPIHWMDYDKAGVDCKYPLLNAANNHTSRDMATAWQVATYPMGYLGSSKSCLIRGTDYGRDVGDQQYVWALVPSITYVAVAMTPKHTDVDDPNVMNRWELFVDGHYVMPMTAAFCGSGHTAAVTVKAKAYEVRSTLQMGLRMGGMSIDAAPSLGINNVRPIMERVVMRDATIKPVPEVTASAPEVPAEGGEVTLTVSSTLKEALYVINDTMCGHDSTAVWCSQSSEEIPAGSGQVVLTLAPNTTGQPRQVWAFVGHHYAQAAVVKINQLA